jgi:hypothetical protein
MPLALQTFIPGFLPSTRDLRFTEVTVEDEFVRLQLTAILALVFLEE